MMQSYPHSLMTRCPNLRVQHQELIFKCQSQLLVSDFRHNPDKQKGWAVGIGNDSVVPTRADQGLYEEGGEGFRGGGVVTRLCFP